MPSFSDVYASVKLDLDAAEEAKLKRRLGNIDTKDAGRKMGVGLSKSLGGGFRASIGGAARSMFGPLIAAGAAIGGFTLFKGFIEDAQEAAKIGRITAQVIESTGGAAKITAVQVSDLSERLSNMTAVDDELVQTGANLLLTFKNVRNEVGQGNKIFDYATAAALDLSAAGFGSVESAAKMLGKALNDPIAGLTALGRAGVTFTAAQKEQIKSLVEQGDMLSAQKIIIGEIFSQVGGAAEAAAGPIDKLKVIFANLGEQIGTVLLPYIEQFATWLATEGATKIQGWITIFKDEWIPTIKDLVTNFRENLWPAIKEVWGFIVDVFEFAWPKIKWVYDQINTAGDRWMGRLREVTAAIDQAWDFWVRAFVDGASFLVNAWFEAVEFILDGAEAMFGWIPGVGDKLREAQKDFQGFRDSVNTSLQGIKDRHPKVTISISSNAGALAADVRARWTGLATGGPVFGQGGPTSDSVLARLSPGEHVWTAREVQAFGGHKAMQLARQQVVRGYARGGLVVGVNTPKVPANTFEPINDAFTDYITATGAFVAKKLQAFVKSRSTALDVGAAPSGPGGLTFPLPRGSYRIGSPYGPRSGGFHGGQDFPAATGTPIFAIAGGVVSRAMSLTGSYGRHVYVAHAGGRHSRYAHMSSILTSVGRAVRPGSVLGRVGSTGNSTGPHLHLETWWPARRNPRGLVFDQGGWLPAGTSLVQNNTGKPEKITPADQPMDLSDRTIRKLADYLARTNAAAIGSAQRQSAHSDSVYSRTS